MRKTLGKTLEKTLEKTLDKRRKNIGEKHLFKSAIILESPLSEWCFSSWENGRTTQLVEGNPLVISRTRYGIQTWQAGKSHGKSHGKSRNSTLETDLKKKVDVLSGH